MVLLVLNQAPGLGNLNFMTFNLMMNMYDLS